MHADCEPPNYAEDGLKASVFCAPGNDVLMANVTLNPSIWISTVKFRNPDGNNPDTDLPPSLPGPLRYHILIRPLGADGAA